MDCKEFRDKISAGNDFNDELIKHKEKCSECQEWLKSELSKAPEGINEDKWNKIISTCLSTDSKIDSEPITEKSNDKKSDEEANKSFMDYYLSGLKYGIVFGLSIVVGFAILQNKNEETNNNQKSTIDTSISSEKENLASESLNLSIATDSEIISLPSLKK